MTPPQDEPVGSVGDEAAKLLGALADWAGDHLRDVDGHVATGSAECLYCPICRTVHAVRQAGPEVKTQLASAASSFLQAAAGLLSTAGHGEQQTSRVQHIDLDDEDDEDDDEDDPDEDTP